MADETDTPLDSGTGDVISETTDTAPEWDYFDPDEDEQATEVTEDEATDDGEQSEDETQDQDEPETEGDEDESGEEKPAEVFELANGEKVTKDELIKGHLRQQDYTRKTMEVAERRKSVEAEAQRLSGITEAFIDHITKLIPAEPDRSLAFSNPAEYQARKVQYDAAVEQVEKLIELGKAGKETTQALSADAQREVLYRENTALAERFPETATKDGRKKFFDGVGEAAMELGFTPEELSKTSDHRLFALAHWASLGMKAEKAREAAKHKVEGAPPAAPKKPGGAQNKSARNRDAMRKLSQTGSIRDALAVDFD